MTQNSPRRAVIDIGSNSLILIIAEQKEGNWIPTYEQTRVTGLGTGTAQSGLLSESAVKLSLRVLQEFFSTARQHGVEGVAACATMAARMATNTESVMEAARTQSTPFSLLRGEDEAELGFLAVAEDPLFRDFPIISIVDPGGNSTELVTASRNGSGWDRNFQKSFPIGALGLRDRVLSQEAPDFGQRLAAVVTIDELLEREVLAPESGVAVVLGATGTNLVSIREHLMTWRPEIVHGAVLDYEEVGRAVGWLCDKTDAERAAIPGIEKGREKTIHIGALILERFLNALHVLDCRVSVRGWRHALLEHDAWFARFQIMP